jgi:hypothetical protein
MLNPPATGISVHVEPEYAEYHFFGWMAGGWWRAEQVAITNRFFDTASMIFFLVSIAFLSLFVTMN